MWNKRQGNNKINKNGRGDYTVSYNNRSNRFTGPIHFPWGFLILKKYNKKNE